MIEINQIYRLRILYYYIYVLVIDIDLFEGMVTYCIKDSNIENLPITKSQFNMKNLETSPIIFFEKRCELYG